MRFIVLFLFFSLPPGSTFVVSLSVKHVINLVWPNFRIFRMLHPLYENKNCENLNVRFLSRVTFDLYAYHSHKRSLAAGAKCKFFAKALKRSDLSDPSGPLSASITIEGFETTLKSRTALKKS